MKTNEEQMNNILNYLVHRVQTCMLDCNKYARNKGNLKNYMCFI